eukprot:Plantae.Rhodophyta-Purpureofilum_apyrenoidigerum.ctg19130.p1 GENE.Plantae.Rhodophyta-Purpureofilum_apyrenoidigerum.ctg19130~~Plantae.Rhodophyta-Purpureofilum_apyrenoidigerum.ctg19130.p1  ORF type:complete len:453 (+),score=73.14 Plantae.Rhodophyta-Purpureofilum_apyrenoidigerum.ctg19130:161-1519(+)
MAVVGRASHTTDSVMMTAGLVESGGHHLDGGMEKRWVEICSLWRKVLDAGANEPESRKGLEQIRDRFLEAIGYIAGQCTNPAVGELLDYAEFKLAPILSKGELDRLFQFKELYEQRARFQSGLEPFRGRMHGESALSIRRRELLNAVKAGETNTKKFYKDGSFSFDADETTRFPLERLDVGRAYTGRVVGIAKFGVFVDIGCEKPGLVHISQIREGFINNVFDEVNMLQLVTVRVASLNLHRRNFACTMRSDVHIDVPQHSRCARPRNSGGPTVPNKPMVDDGHERSAANIAADLAISVLKDDLEDDMSPIPVMSFPTSGMNTPLSFDSSLSGKFSSRNFDTAPNADAFAFSGGEDVEIDRQGGRGIAAYKNFFAGDQEYRMVSTRGPFGVPMMPTSTLELSSMAGHKNGPQGAHLRSQATTAPRRGVKSEVETGSLDVDELGEKLVDALLS